MRSIVQPSAIITESHLIANQSYYDLCIMISSYAAIQIETENKLIRIQRFRDVNVESIIVAIQKRQRTNDNKSFRRDWSWFDDGKINELYWPVTTQGNYNFVVVMFASDDGNDDIQISMRNDSVSIVSGEQWIAYGSNMAHTHNAGCLRNRGRSGSTQSLNGPFMPNYSPLNHHIISTWSLSHGRAECANHHNATMQTVYEYDLCTAHSAEKLIQFSHNYGKKRRTPAILQCFCTKCRSWSVVLTDETPPVRPLTHLAAKQRERPPTHAFVWWSEEKIDCAAASIINHNNLPHRRPFEQWLRQAQQPL